MKLNEEFGATCHVNENDGLVAYSGKSGVELQCHTLDDDGVLLEREDAVRFARWILDVCEATP